MKNINIAITDPVDAKLDEIMHKKDFKNRADAIAWLIEEGFSQLFKEEPAA